MPPRFYAFVNRLRQTAANQPRRKKTPRRCTVMKNVLFRFTPGVKWLRNGTTRYSPCHLCGSPEKRTFFTHQATVYSRVQGEGPRFTGLSLTTCLRFACSSSSLRRVCGSSFCMETGALKTITTTHTHTCLVPGQCCYSTLSRVRHVAA